MTKIWAEVFWKPAPRENVAAGPRPAAQPATWMLVPVAALTALTVLIGLGAEFVFQFADQAAAELINPAQYVQAVLGDRL